MDEKITKMLEEEIIQEIEDLSALQIGSEAKSKAVDDLTKLCKLRIESERTKLDFEEKSQRQIMDNKNAIEVRNCEDIFRKEQLNLQRNEMYARIGIAAFEIGLGLIFNSVWMDKGFKFEKEGTYTSPTFRNLWSHFRIAKR